MTPRGSDIPYNSHDEFMSISSSSPEPRLSPASSELAENFRRFKEALQNTSPFSQSQAPFQDIRIAAAAATLSPPSPSPEKKIAFVIERELGILHTGQHYHQSYPFSGPESGFPSDDESHMNMSGHYSPAFPDHTNSVSPRIDSGSSSSLSSPPSITTELLSPLKRPAALPTPSLSSHSPSFRRLTTSPAASFHRRSESSSVFAGVEITSRLSEAKIGRATTPHATLQTGFVELQPYHTAPLDNLPGPSKKTPTAPPSPPSPRRNVTRQRRTSTTNSPPRKEDLVPLGKNHSTVESVPWSKSKKGLSVPTVALAEPDANNSFFSPVPQLEPNPQIKPPETHHMAISSVLSSFPPFLPFLQSEGLGTRPLDSSHLAAAFSSCSEPVQNPSPTQSGSSNSAVQTLRYPSPAAVPSDGHEVSYSRSVPSTPPEHLESRLDSSHVSSAETPAEMDAHLSIHVEPPEPHPDSFHEPVAEAPIHIDVSGNPSSVSPDSDRSTALDVASKTSLTTELSLEPEILLQSPLIPTSSLSSRVEILFRCSTKECEIASGPSALMAFFRSREAFVAHHSTLGGACQGVPMAYNVTAVYDVSPSSADNCMDLSGMSEDERILRKAPTVAQLRTITAFDEHTESYVNQLRGSLRATPYAFQSQSASFGTPAATVGSSSSTNSARPMAFSTDAKKSTTRPRKFSSNLASTSTPEPRLPRAQPYVDVPTPLDSQGSSSPRLFISLFSPREKGNDSEAIMRLKTEKASSGAHLSPGDRPALDYRCSVCKDRAFATFLGATRHIQRSDCHGTVLSPPAISPHAPDPGNDKSMIQSPLHRASGRGPPDEPSASVTPANTASNEAPEIPPPELKPGGSSTDALLSAYECGACGPDKIYATKYLLKRHRGGAHCHGSTIKRRLAPVSTCVECNTPFFTQIVESAHRCRDPYVADPSDDDETPSPNDSALPAPPRPKVAKPARRQSSPQSQSAQSAFNTIDQVDDKETLWSNTGRPMRRKAPTFFAMYNSLEKPETPGAGPSKPQKKKRTSLALAETGRDIAPPVSKRPKVDLELVESGLTPTIPLMDLPCEESSVEGVVIRTQTSVCLALSSQGIPKCAQCRSRKTGDTCRFINIRQLHYRDDVCIGQSFVSNAENVDFQYPINFNIPPTDRHQLSVLKHSLAHSLLDVLKEEHRHIKHDRIIRRQRETAVRVTCDICQTSIFAGCWMCTICGKEVCGDCFTAIKVYDSDDLTHVERPARNASTEEKGKHRVLRCRGTRWETEAHRARAFIPVSRFTNGELEDIIQGMTRLVDNPPLLSNTTALNESESSEHLPFASRCPTNDPAGVPTLDLLTFEHDKLTEDVFRPIWAQGIPLVVKGLRPAFKLDWSPEYFIVEFGPEECQIMECNTGKSEKSTVEAFFKLFGQYGGRKGILKLKDWPPTEDFRTSFPKLFQDFSQAVPIPNYTRRDGILNIASHFPRNTVAPDIGPKMYNAFEASEAPGGKGSTRLHMDMADAVNVMLYASPREDGSPGYAAWNIYRAEDADPIREFLREKFPETDRGLDPVHNQQHFLDVDLRRELYETKGVKSFRIHQYPGEAVFIPAGCAHQVCNIGDCIKVAVDFVSPENIERCAKLTREFREQNQAASWKEDVLQLKSMMWFAWESIRRLEKTLDEEEGKEKEGEEEAKEEQRKEVEMMDMDIDAPVALGLGLDLYSNDHDHKSEGELEIEIKDKSQVKTESRGQSDMEVDELEDD